MPRAIVPAVLLGCLAACAGLGDRAPDAPPASQAWIEIPLGTGVFREHERDYRTDVIDISLDARQELEYKLDMREGDSIVYEWNVLEISDPALLYAEFHGHTERVGDAPGTLMFYRKASGGNESGSLVAPFTGIHGWYLVNNTDAPIVVRLNVAGFYDLLGV